MKKIIISAVCIALFLLLTGCSKKDEAKDMYEKAHELFSIFWALRLKLVTLPEAAKSTESEMDGAMTTKDIMNKLIDCCKE